MISGLQTFIRVPPVYHNKLSQSSNGFCDSLQVLVQLPPAASGPVISVEVGLDPRRHDAAQWHVIITIIGLPIMFHA